MRAGTMCMGQGDCSNWSAMVGSYTFPLGTRKEYVSSFPTTFSNTLEGGVTVVSEV